jgi:hypothetical protein
MPILFEAYSCGGNTGAKKVKKIWNTVQGKRDKKNNEEVWLVLDYDRFKRSENNVSSYKFAGNNLYFFVMNFEDFLTQHLDGQTLSRWQNICIRQNHFKKPMPNDALMQNIVLIFPEYKKGSIPFDLNKNVLNNLIANRGTFIQLDEVKDFIEVFADFLRSKKIV